MSRKKSKSRGNVKAESSYDPFPKSGLIKQYEPFIRKSASEFCEHYPQLPRDDVLLEAVRLAWEAERRFKPEKGYVFATLLRHYLKGLHRFAERELFGKSLAKPKEAKSPRPEFLGGANGARVTLDLQFADPGHRRAALGVQLSTTDADHVRSLWDRASPDVRFLLGYDSDLARKQAYIRAILDHHERCQDEIAQGALLEPRSRTGGVDIKHYKGRKPPRFEDHVPTASLEDAYRHDDEWVGKLSDTIADGGAPSPPDHGLIDAINAERPFLSGHRAVTADWMAGLLSGTDTRSLVQFADAQGISKGYASKLRDQVAERIKKRLQK